MGVNWGGLGSGIERGVGLGLALDQNRQYKEDRVYNRGIQERQLALSEETNKRSIDTHELTMAVSRLELDEFKDEKKRKNALEGISAQQYATQMFQRNLKDGTFKTQAELQAASDTLNAGNIRLMNLVGNKMLNKNNKEGERKQVGRLFPHAPSGKLLFELDITDEDGNVLRSAPLTTGQSADPDDPVALIDQSQVVQYMAKAQQVLTDLDRMAIRRGDTGPIDRMRAGAEKTEERAYDATVAKQKQADAVALEGVKQQGRVGLQAAKGLTTAGLPPGEAGQAQWLMNQGVATDPRQAYEMAKRARDNPRDAIIDIATSLHEQQWSSGEPERDFNSFIKEAQGIVQQLGASEQAAGARGLSSAPPMEGADTTAAPMIINRQTGERMILQDGAWVPVR